MEQEQSLIELVKDWSNITPTEFKAVRKKLKMTQKQFATKLGYTSNVIIYMKENGGSPIKIRDMMLLKAIVDEKATQGL